MSKQREALQMALDALSSDSPDIMLRASVAIREALAEPKPVSHHSEDALDMVKARQIACEYTQPNSNIDSGNLYWALHVALRHSAPPTRADGDHFGDVTEMAARKPLTDEEIMKTAKETQSAEPGRDGYILPFAFARAIERAHGITE